MKPNRNDPCPCGSGKKYKHCCERKNQRSSPLVAIPSQSEVKLLLALSASKRFLDLGQASVQLIEKYPTSGVAWKLFAEALFMQGKDALPALLKATELMPEDIDTLNNLGLAQAQRGIFTEAVISYQQALRMQPDSVRVLNNLGNALQDLGRYEDAHECYRRAVGIDPNYVRAQSNLLFTFNLTECSPESYLKQALKYGEIVSRKVVRYQSWRHADISKKLCIGLVSGDLRSHPVGYFLENFLAQLDNSRIELIAYTNSPIEDDLTLRIKPHFAHWREIYALDDPTAAGLIHSDGVHILIDLSGHTAHNRLPVFAWKPAPVQCTWLGYFASTGLSTMDYILGDRWTLPPDEAYHFVEQGWQLPETLTCLGMPQMAPDVAALPALRNRFITFGTLNKTAKMNVRVMACWARILKLLPESRLYLNTSALRDPDTKKSIVDRYASLGVAEDRLILEATTGRSAALSSYNRIDIALDPFPYPGGTTSYESLWMGVPILTMRGNTYLSHLGESILHNAGLPGWIAASEDDYVAKAVRFAGDLPELSALRDQLRGQVRASPLFDAPRFAKHFEEALWGMWRDKMRGSPLANQEHPA